MAQFGTTPWHLARTERDGDPPAAVALDAALDLLVRSCQTLAEHLKPFLPDTAARITVQCTPSAGRLPRPQPLFPKISLPTR